MANVKTLQIGSTNYNLDAYYADSAGNADTLDGNHASAFASASHAHSWDSITGKPSSMPPYFANNTWYTVGDDCAIGDHNIGGTFCIKGLNSTPGIYLYSNDDSYYASVIHSANIGSQSVNYANSAGSATTASKLGTNAGAYNQPIYFSNGIPVSCSYSLNKSVPSDAVFTDHTYNFGGTTFYSGNSGNAEHNCNNATANGHYYYSSNGPSTSLGATTDDGALYTQSYSDAWVGQIAQDYRNGRLFVRGKNNGTWQSWRRILDSASVVVSGTTLVI